MGLGSRSPQDDQISVDRLIRSFSRLLHLSWSEIEQASQHVQTGSYLEDWLQANWEMFVEGALPPGTFLEVYGDGADCNGASSRVYMPEAIPTHRIICLPKADDTKVVDRLGGGEIEFGPDGLSLDRLVAIEETKYAEEPPFDCVLICVDDAHPRAAHFDDLRFELSRNPTR